MAQTTTAKQLPSTALQNKIHLKFQKWQNKLEANPKKEKLVLTGLTISLGAFGVHRLYLGTSPHVPAVYTLSGGGVFMIIPLVDLIHILATKDLEKYRNNPRVFMWGGATSTQP